MINRPSGTVTFLFTDIEGSTQLWEHHPEWMERAHKRQEEIIRDAVAAHNGYAYKMIGDAFQIAFATARHALEAAIDMQHALHAEKWGNVGGIRVRMALHTGVTEERGDDYVGPVLNRVARLMSAGHGGQILISDAVQSLVRDRLAAGITLLDLGERRLKDLTRAERLYQVVSPDLPLEFPPLKTLDTLPNNLPLQLTSFIGREKEIEEVKSYLTPRPPSLTRKGEPDQVRLLTLTGAGGCGKTRLALQVGTDLIESFDDGAWFVELAPLADPALVAQVVASILGLQEGAGRSLETTLKDYLREKNLLLILDNCEHLIAACAQLSNKFLHACPHLKILATSREALGVAGETAFRVPSLTVPDLQHLPPIESLSQYDAVRLFFDRAISMQSTFTVNNHNASAVAQICHRLDGIPLALELAAARIKIFSAEEIEKRLDDRFRLLTGGSRTAMPRQQTLRALIDWSFDLLSEPERVFLSRLSVFAGGWTFDAAEAICSDQSTVNSNGSAVSTVHRLQLTDILDLLSHLIDKSLVLAEEQDGVTRYRMLETIRQYAREKLLETDQDENVRNRHLDYFLKFAQEAEPKLRGPEQFEWLDRLDIELDNLRAALEWSVGEGRVEIGLRLAAALKWFWDMRAYWNEGRERTERLLILPEAAPRTLTRANALIVAAEMAGSQGDDRSNREHLEELIAIAREHQAEGERLLALGLGRYSSYIFKDDPVAAESMLEEGLTLARSLGDEWLIGLLLLLRGHLFMGRNDLRAARKAFEESRARFNFFGDKRMAADVSFNISRVNFREGEYARARQEIEQGLPFFRQAKDRHLVWNSVNSLGMIAHAEARYDLAKRYYGEGLELARELGGKLQIAVASGNLAYVAVHDGELISARSLLAESLALAREIDYKPTMAFAFIGFASIAAAEKHAQRAVQLFAVGDTLLQGGDKRTVTPVDEEEYKRNLAIAREQLDENAFNTAWAEGRALTLEQAIEFALVQPVESSEPIASAQPHDPNALTPREIEVLRLAQAGLSDARIAEKLVISRRTVNTHLSSIYSKLGVNSRSAATRYALDHRLI